MSEDSCMILEWSLCSGDAYDHVCGLDTITMCKNVHSNCVVVVASAVCRQDGSGSYVNFQDKNQK